MNRSVKIFLFLYFILCSVLSHAFFDFVFYKPKTVDEAKNWVETYYDIESEKLSDEIGELKIVHLSDFHKGAYGLPFDLIYTFVKEQNPDLIVLTGDMVEGQELENKVQSFFDVESIQLMAALSGVAETYYVMGNNDYFKSEYAQRSYERLLIDAGVHILKDRTTEITYKGQKISICGINDPVYDIESGLSSKEITRRSLDEASIPLKDDTLNILLAHRPEHFDLYQTYGYDIIFAGHTHGGQFQILNQPVTKIPGQSFPAKYVNGKYEENNKYMIVSRGLGTSNIHLRINCPPEIGIITLIQKK